MEAAQSANATPALGGVGVGIVAPGGYAPDPVALDRAEQLLCRHGARVRRFCADEHKHERFGASDAERAAALHAAATDPQVDVVLALRGGYGATRLLPLLDLDLLARSGKLFVGHSDFTALGLALLAKGGCPSFSGPMVCDDFGRAEPSDFTIDDFLRCLRGPEHAVSFSGRDLPALDLRGTFWGGNLAMLTHLVGTPYLPQVDGGILFVEDINEHPYRIERMLLQLHHAGVLQRQQALVLGDFSGYRLSEYDNGYDFDAMLRYIRAVAGIPVLTGLPFGHIRDKVTLPVGAQAHVTTDPGAARIVFSGYPCLNLRIQT